MSEIPISIRNCVSQELKQRATELWANEAASKADKDRALVDCIRANMGNKDQVSAKERREVFIRFLTHFNSA
jgi:hypothetical protein